MSSTGLVHPARQTPYRAAGRSLNLVKQIKFEVRIGQLLGGPEEGQCDLGSKFLKGSNQPHASTNLESFKVLGRIGSPQWSG